MKLFGSLIMIRKFVGKLIKLLGFYLAIRRSEHDSKNHETDSLGPRSGYHSRLTESVSQSVRSENLSF